MKGLPCCPVGTQNGFFGSVSPVQELKLVEASGTSSVTSNKGSPGQSLHGMFGDSRLSALSRTVVSGAARPFVYYYAWPWAAVGSSAQGPLVQADPSARK